MLNDSGTPKTGHGLVGQFWELDSDRQGRPDSEIARQAVEEFILRYQSRFLRK
jgi:hypothetical protein